MATPPLKLVIQMSGAPGSGKSTVARLLRPYIHGVIIDHDVIRSTLLCFPAILPFDQAAKQAYTLQWELANDLIKQGVDAVIIDSTCNYDEVLEQGTSLAAQHGYTYWYVECKVTDVELLDKRLRGRCAMASQRTSVECPPVAAQGNGARIGEDAFALFAKWTESPCRPARHHTITVDSTAHPEMIRDEILKRISKA